ncbi:addiction module protein [Leptospira interrogans serovar Icterohaemorrhagiae]|uniref:Putative addiction module component n=1 Tax=Leptospira interrogans str. UI 12621 TaxID=1049937 RepID=A0A0F6H6P2_LEPIR|nr:addiction module protein [Leptospira interrogans]EKO23896.1 putative addiction module component [Leptospira interrogans str. UI 12621]QOI34591.1 addiction module protein [Leptospira interrogans serovar Icterohaemorrhagiae]UML83344.1 addiction module protein [Leptospira interrogans]
MFDNGGFFYAKDNAKNFSRCSWLSADDKEILIHELLVELDSTPATEINRLQMELIDRRHRDMIEGRVKSISSQESDARIRARLNETK